MANGRSQRVGLRHHRRGGRRHLRLRPAAQAVRRRRLVLVRRRRRRRGRDRRVGGVDRRGSRGPGRARHRRHRHHHDEPARTSAPSCSARSARTTSCAPTSTRSSSWSRAPRRSSTRRSSPRPRPRSASTLRVIEQGNLGGSGGYARGQLESVTKGTATYLMCMDDDVVVRARGRSSGPSPSATWPGARRSSAATCSASTRRSRLHSFGEIVQPWRFWWQSAPGVFTDWDFAARNLRSARWLHQRDRRRLQRLVHVPDPAPGAGRDRPLACRCSSSGTTPSSGCAPRRPATPR